MRTYWIAACLFSILLGMETGAEAGVANPTDVYVPRPPGTLTFTRDIASIIFRNCAVCHRPSGSGPFPLLTYGDVKRQARQIVAVTKSRFMPPWLPEPGDLEFAAERRLSVDQIGIVGQWVEEGAMEGNPSDLPSAPVWKEGWQFGEPDLVIRMDESYTLPAAGRDVFRNFVIPIPVSTGRYVVGMELQPGNPKIVHHAVLMIDRTPASRHLDEQDPGVGFNGMFTPSSAHNPDGHFLGWTPGKVPFKLPEEMAWRLKRGSSLLLQLHMLPSGKPEQIGARAGFYFTGKPPTQIPVLIRLGSRTIDIPAGKKDYRIEDTYRLPVDVEVLSVYPHAHYLAREMKGIATFPDGSQTTLLHIREWDFNWQDEYRYAQPVPLPQGTTLSMQFTYDNSVANIRNPHTPPRHVLYGPESSDEMGDFWIQLLPANSDDLEILRRDFAVKELQAQRAGYEKELEVDPNDVWARYHLGALLHSEGKLEKAIAQFREVLRLSPDDAQAHNTLGSALSSQGKLEEAIRHFRKALQLKPDYVLAHNSLGIALASQGKQSEAIRHYQQVLKITPDYAATRNNLGVALASQGRLQEAIEHFRQGLQADPDLVEMNANLGGTLKAQGKLEEAARHYTRALELNPDYAPAHNGLGIVLGSQGKLEEAIRHFRQALEVEPDFPNAHFNLGLTLQSQGRLAEGQYSQGRAFSLIGRIREALEHFREAIRLEPDNIAPLQSMAWILSTHPDPNFRDGEEALRLARHASKLVGGKNAGILKTLAAAYAATGQFDRATATAKTALELALAEKDEKQVADLGRHLDLYRHGKPLREVPPTQGIARPLSVILTK